MIELSPFADGFATERKFDFHFEMRMSLPGMFNNLLDLLVIFQSPVITENSCDFLLCSVEESDDGSVI